MSDISMIIFFYVSMYLQLRVLYLFTLALNFDIGKSYKNILCILEACLLIINV